MGHKLAHGEFTALKYELATSVFPFVFLPFLATISEVGASAVELTNDNNNDYDDHNTNLRHSKLASIHEIFFSFVTWV